MELLGFMQIKPRAAILSAVCTAGCTLTADAGLDASATNTPPLGSETDPDATHSAPADSDGPDGDSTGPGPSLDGSGDDGPGNDASGDGESTGTVPDPPGLDWPALGGVEPGDPSILGELAEPGYLDWTLDPRTTQFDDARIPTEVARVTDATTFGVNSTELRHQYAKVSPWNADGSYAMVFARGDSTRAVLLDGETFEFIRILPDTYTGGRWSLRDPEIYLQRSGTGPRLTKTHVTTGNTEIVRDFSPEGYVELAAVGMFGGEGNQSWDDRLWVVELRHPSRGWELVIYDRDADEITGVIAVPNQVPNNDNVDNWGVSPLGTFIVTQSKVAWSHRGVDVPEGINVWSPQGEYLRTSPPSMGHIDYCLDTEGHEVMFYIGDKYGNNDKTGQTWRLDGSTGAESTDQFDDGLVGWNFHVSCSSTSRPGWGVVSTFPSDSPESYDSFPMWNHTFAVPLDGSKRVALVAGVHHNSSVEHDAYRRSSFAVPNRDLTAVWFSAHWDAVPGASIHSFVARPRL